MPAVSRPHPSVARGYYTWLLIVAFVVSSNRRRLAAEEKKMEMQRWTLVIDLFAKSYDGIIPSIVLTCDETWLGAFAVAPPNPPAVESHPDGRVCLSP